MKNKITIFFCVVFLTACETTPSYDEQINQRALPSSAQDLEQECSWVRGEIARMHSVSSAAATSQYALAFQAKARRNIASLESRAANIGCRSAFSSQSNQRINNVSKIQQCINACIKNTEHTKEICFDLCNK